MHDTKTSYFSSNEIKIPITIADHPTMIFPMREVLNEKAKHVQKLHSETAQDLREKHTHTYQCELLRHLLTRKPENLLPGFPEVTDDTFADTIADFLLDVPEGSIEADKKKDLVTNLFILYWRAVQPAEFFI